MKIAPVNNNYTNQNTQKNNPNFGMFRIDKPMSEYINCVARLGRPVEDSLMLTSLNRFFNHLRVDLECGRQIFQLMKKNPGVYHIEADRTLIQQAQDPVAKAAELITNARTFTIEEIDTALAAPNIVAAEKDFKDKSLVHRAIHLLAGFKNTPAERESLPAMVQTILNEGPVVKDYHWRWDEGQSEAQLIDLKKVALMELFGTMEKKA